MRLTQRSAFTIRHREGPVKIKSRRLGVTKVIDMAGDKSIHAHTDLELNDMK
jgi:hypothetical protein